MNLEEPILIIDTIRIFMSPVMINQFYRIPHTVIPEFKHKGIGEHPLDTA